MAEANLTALRVQRRRAARGRQPARLARSPVSGRTSRSRSMPASRSAPFQIAYKTYGTLNAERSQCGAGLPCADRRPACGERASGHRQAGLVGDHGRARQADRHRPLFRHLRQRDRRLHGHAPARLRPIRRPASPGALEFPVITIRDMVRAQAMLLDHLGIDTLFCGGRRLDGRHAGAGMGRELSRARVRGAADRLRHPPFGAEHRLPRGRPPGDHGRSGMARRQLPHRKAPIRAAASRSRAWRAHITYLSDAALHRKFGRKFQDRDNADLLVRRRFRGRILSAPPGQLLRRALRRQFLSLSHARHGLFRPRRRPRRAGRAMPSRARRRASA